ncbi:MAG: hypothetical protein RLZZ46_1465, partial [Bacteroidota bacterium]
IIVSAITYYIFDYRYKQNNRVLERIENRGIKSLYSGDVKLETKADFLILQDRLKMENGEKPLFRERLDQLKNDSIALLTINAMLEKLNYKKQYDSLYYCQDVDYLGRVFEYGSIIFEKVIKRQIASLSSTNLINAGRNYYTFDFMKLSTLMKMRFPKNAQILNNIKRIASCARNGLEENLKYADYKKNGLYQSHFIDYLYVLLSIDDDADYTFLQQYYTNGSRRLLQTVNPDNCFTSHTLGNDFPFGGYYEIMMLSYVTELRKNPAAIENILPLIDSTTNNTQCTYNPITILGAIARFSNDPAAHIEAFMKRYYRKLDGGANVVNIANYKLFQSFMIPCCFIQSYENSFLIKFSSQPGYTIPRDNLNKLWDLYLNYCQKLPEDRSLSALASAYKQKAFFHDQVSSEKNLVPYCFEKTLEYAGKLKAQIKTDSGEKIDFENGEKRLAYNRLFNFFPSSFLVKTNSDNFQFTSNGEINLIESNHSILLDYLINTGRLSLYFTPDQSKILEAFCAYGEDKLTAQVLDIIRKNRKELPEIKPVTKLTLKIDSLLHNGSFKDTLEVKQLLDELKPFYKDNIMIQYIIELAFAYAKAGLPRQSTKFTELAQTSSETEIPMIISMRLANEENAERIMYFINYIHEKKYNKKQASSSVFYRILGRTGGSPVENYSFNMMSREPEILKPRAIENFITGVAETSRLYKAYTFIPDYLSPDSKLRSINKILESELMRRVRKTRKNYRDGKWNDRAFFTFDPDPEIELQNLTKTNEPD